MHPLSQSRIGQIALTVNDLSAAVAFYRDSLGLSLMFEAGNMVFFDVAGQRLMLTTNTDAPEVRYSSILYFTVADMAAAYADLLAVGTVFDRPPAVEHRAPGFELWLAFFRDPSGNVHALMEERRVPVDA